MRNRIVRNQKTRVKTHKECKTASPYEDWLDNNAPNVHADPDFYLAEQGNEGRDYRSDLVEEVLEQYGLSCLSSREKEAFTLHVYGCFSITETAKIMGCKAAAVVTLLKRSGKKLRILCLTKTDKLDL